ncbi:hypothetical protein V6N13_059196 [Hibiscus sabdariffa]
MVSMKVIVEHFEDTIKDHPKTKIKEIQRKIQSELHVNVLNARCRRAKNLVTSRLAGSCKEEFALLWDYADELRAKNPGSTINMEPIADGEAILLLRHLSYGEEPKDFRKNGLQRTLNRNPNQKPKVGKMKRTNT